MEQIRSEDDSMILVADIKAIKKNEAMRASLNDVLNFSNQEHHILVEKVKSYGSRLGINCRIKTLIVIED